MANSLRRWLLPVSVRCDMRILLVQLADIGDLIITTPALDALREALPDATLDLLIPAHTASIIENTGLVDNIIIIDRQALNQSRGFFALGNLGLIYNLRHNRYDAVIFFHHFTLRLGTIKFALIAMLTGAKRRIGLQNGKGWFLTESILDEGFGAKHQAQYWLDLVGLLSADTAFRPTKINIQSEAPSLFKSSKMTVVIHPGSGGYSLARRWDAVHFAAVADTLQTNHNVQVVMVGTEHDNTQAVIQAMQTIPIDLTGKTQSLSELAAVIQQADLFIGADSGVMHVASATRTPIVAIFGPSNPQAWHPWTPQRHCVIRSTPECSPCSYVEHGIGLREGCAARTCMRMVTPNHVLVAATDSLSSSRSPSTIQTPSRQPYEHQRIEILGLPVDAITFAGWLDLIDQWVADSDRCHHVCTTNPEFIIIAQSDPNFHNILKRADLCVPDGVGLLWAARRKGMSLPERVTGSDGVPLIAEQAAEKGWKLYFLGAAPGVADRAAEVLQKRHPTLQIVGIYSGTPAPEEEDEIVAMINSSAADLLFVAYGAPEQDKWIARNLPRLQVKMAMGVGGSFDFIAGVIPRAPLWMRQAGLEWLYRLYLQPSRIGRMTRLPRFVLQILLAR